MKKLLIILLLCSSAFAQSTAFKKQTSFKKQTWFGAAAATATFVCVQGGLGCTNTTANTCTAASATSATCTFASNITAGNGVIMACSSFHQLSSVSGSSDTFTADVSVLGPATNQYVSIYHVASSVGGYTSVVANAAAGSYFSCSAIEVTHLSALDTSATQSGNSGTNCTSPPAGTNCISASATANPSSGTLTPLTSGDLFVGVSWNSSSAGTLNWAGANALYDNSSNNVGDIAYLIDAASAAQQAVWTHASANWITAIAAYKHP